MQVHSIAMNKTKQDIRRFIIRVGIPNVYKGFTNIQNFVLQYSILFVSVGQFNITQLHYKAMAPTLREQPPLLYLPLFSLTSMTLVA